MSIRGYIVCTVDPAKAAEICKILRSIEHVVFCDYVSDSNDILLTIEGNNSLEILELVRNKIDVIPGIKKTETLFKEEDAFLRQTFTVKWEKIFTAIFKLPTHIKEWPVVFKKFVVDPSKESARIPVEGEWEKPLSWIIAAFLLSGLFNIFVFKWLASMARINWIMWVRIFVFMMMLPCIKVFIYASLLDRIIGIFGKRPGYYRTFYFLAVFSPIVIVFSPVLAVSSVLLFFICVAIFFALNIYLKILIVFLNFGVLVLYLYLLYHFLRGAALYTPEKADTFVRVVAWAKVFQLLVMMTIFFFLIFVKGHNPMLG